MSVPAPAQPTRETAEVSPDDIPTAVTELIYSAPFKNFLSQNNVADLLAHFWPAIEQHVRNVCADEIETASVARLDEIDEDELRPSDQDQHQEWLDAAALIRPIAKES